LRKGGQRGAEALEQRFELRNHENEQNDRYDDGDGQHGHRIEHRFLDLLLEGFGLLLVGRDFIDQRFEGAGLLAALDRILLKFPVIGPILVKAAIARFARTLSTMFAAGVPLVEAMGSVAGATGNIVYEQAVLRMKDEVATGQRLQRAMENTGLFPNMVIQMIAVGEESGALDTMSAKVADFYEAEVDNAVDSMSSLLEPMIMAILGVLVGGMVIAMYLPIFKLGSVVG